MKFCTFIISRQERKKAHFQLCPLRFFMDMESESANFTSFLEGCYTYVKWCAWNSSEWSNPLNYIQYVVTKQQRAQHHVQFTWHHLTEETHFSQVPNTERNRRELDICGSHLSSTKLAWYEIIFFIYVNTNSHILSVMWLVKL